MDVHLTYVAKEGREETVDDAEEEEVIEEAGADRIVASAASIREGELELCKHKRGKGQAQN
jgi:hypothetical protein